MTGAPVGLTQLAVMIVDDNRHMRSLICSIMRALGIKKIKEIGDGESALADISAFEPDIMITDWHMGPMDGTTLVKTLRHSSVDTVRYLPIIMLLGHSDTVRVREARDCGVHDFLTKPVSAKSLLARLTKIIEHPPSFIKTEYYFGSDRRRQDSGPTNGVAEQRTDKAKARARAAGGVCATAQMSPEDVPAI
jgi:PleD family two-component response regulator